MLTRIAVNILCLGILLASFTAVYYVTFYSFNMLRGDTWAHNATTGSSALGVPVSTPQQNNVII